ETIGNLPLHTLDLSNNQLQSLTETIANLTQLQSVDFSNNPLLFIDRKILERFPNNETIKQFIDECNYSPKSPWAKLYHAIITRKTVDEINEAIRDAFFALDENDKELICQSRNLQMEQMFDAPAVFFQAVRQMGLLKFKGLNQDA